jgi:LmbE family N-acetylglucosaminyl deacetylase
MNNVVCVFAAHPDDEVLGCGGTIVKHIQNGDSVHVIIMAEGVTSRNNAYNKDQEEKLKNLREVAIKANDLLGSTSLGFLNFPDNRMDSLPLLEIIKKIELVISEYKPNIVYTHHASDVNIDHQKTHEAVITACRPQPGCSVRRVMCFEVQSSTEWQPASSKLAFMPNWFNDISDSFLEKKLIALSLYDCEMRSWPHARSIKAIEVLARWRGSCIGTSAAEAFVLARNIT